MDGTKKPLGVVTMVYRDYFFLERWYAYYANIVGAENLYIFSHGPDARHDKIAVGANVIHIPRDSTKYRFERRRWNMMSKFTSGMLDFYNWMILSDVDEVIVADPDVSENLLAHLSEFYWDEAQSPINIAPICLDMVHVPALEPEIIGPSDKILSKRRTFRPNRNYSKPSLVRRPVKFRSGGHLNDLGERHLPDHLYTLHLKYCDAFSAAARELARKDQVASPNFGLNEAQSPFLGKEMDPELKNILDTHSVVGEDLALPEIRAKMREQIQVGRNRFEYGIFNKKSGKLYQIPERFASVF